MESVKAMGVIGFLVTVWLVYLVYQFRKAMRDFAGE